MQSITTAFLLAEITPDKPDMQVCAAPMTATGKGFVEMYLAAGLPLTSFGRDKKAFQDYLCRGGKRCPSAMKDKTMPSRSPIFLETTQILTVIRNSGYIRN